MTNEKIAIRGYGVVAETKSLNSLELKIRNLYFGNFEMVNDFSRASFICKDLNDLKIVVEYLKNKLGNPIFYKDRFNFPFSNGYRDITMIFQSDKHFLINESGEKFFLKFEIQIHLCNVFLINHIEHVIYEVRRVVELIINTKTFEMIIKSGNITEEMWKDMISNFIRIGNSISKKYFHKVENAYYSWNKNKNYSLSQNFLKEIKKFSKILYSKAMNDYYLNKNNTFTCNLNWYRNKECKMNMIMLKQNSIKYF